MPPGFEDIERSLYRQTSVHSVGPMSRLESSIEAGSEEDIIPRRPNMSPRHCNRDRERDRGGGILRTTEVVISR